MCTNNRLNKKNKTRKITLYQQCKSSFMQELAEQKKGKDKLKNQVVKATGAKLFANRFQPPSHFV